MILFIFTLVQISFFSRTRKDVKMPNSHFVWHRLVWNGDGNTIELQEDAEARYAILGPTRFMPTD